MAQRYDTDHMHLQTASGKIAPSWGPERDKQYPFRIFEADVNMWMAATDIDPHRQGPSLALRLTGQAKELVREIDPHMLVQGRDVVDDQGQMAHIDGVTELMRQLRRRFAPLDQEAQLYALSMFFSFHRQHHEDTDMVVSRFEIVRHRAMQIGGLGLNEVALSWMLLQHMRIPKERWPLILAPTLGHLPSNIAQYNDFINYIRRNGHLYDSGHDHAKSLNQYPVFPTDNTNNDDPNNDYEPFWTFPTFSDPTGNHWGPEQDYNTHEEDGASVSTLSSAESGASEIDLSDVVTSNYMTACEDVYFGYRNAKRRWRKFSGHRKTFHRHLKRRKGGKGSKGSGKFHSPTFFKGRGKSKGKGKGFQAPSYFDNAEAYQHSAYDAASSWEWEQQSYFGKGNKGPHKQRLNPIGRDGKRMLCSECQSETHFRAHCPKGKGKGNAGGKPAFMTADSWPVVQGTTRWPTDNNAAPAASSSSSAGRRIYFSEITFSDGSTEPIHSDPVFNYLALESHDVQGNGKQQKQYLEYYHITEHKFDKTAIDVLPVFESRSSMQETCYHSQVK